MSGRGKGGKGLGKGGPKRHRKVLRDSIQGITKPEIKRLARKGGLKKICGLIYDDVIEINNGSIDLSDYYPREDDPRYYVHKSWDHIIFIENNDSSKFLMYVINSSHLERKLGVRKHSSGCSLLKESASFSTGELKFLLEHNKEIIDFVCLGSVMGGFFIEISPDEKQDFLELRGNPTIDDDVVEAEAEAFGFNGFANLADTPCIDSFVNAFGKSMQNCSQNIRIWDKISFYENYIAVRVDAKMKNSDCFINFLLKIKRDGNSHLNFHKSGANKCFDSSCVCRSAIIEKVYEIIKESFGDKFEI